MNALEYTPQVEYKSGGVKVSEQVVVVDEDGEMYIARKHESNGATYWKEEDLGGLNSMIPNVVAWAEKPQVKF